jgi:hypothetical protein
MWLRNPYGSYTRTVGCNFGKTLYFDKILELLILKTNIKNMRQITYLGLAIIIINLIACGQTPQKQVETNSPKDWKTIGETDFTIQYPDSFDLDKSGQMGTSFIIFSKQTSNQDLFRERI